MDEHTLTQPSDGTRHQEYLGPLPPLLPPPAETNVGQPDVPSQHITIRQLLDVKPETNTVCVTITAFTILHEEH